jgi:hypothetical protein
MANRVLRDWTTSEKIDSLTELSELFFVRLIMKADDHGCFHANPKLLKAALFPLKDYSENQMALCLKELEQFDIIHVYEHDGRKYLKINDFGQRLRNMVSKFPQPADNSRPIDSNKPPETKRNETEKETETNARVSEKRDFEWFKKQIDEIWTDQLPTDKKNKLGAAIENAWRYLSANELELRVADSARCKRLVNNAFQYIKEGTNGTDTKRKNTNSAEIIETGKHYGNKW